MAPAASVPGTPSAHGTTRHLTGSDLGAVRDLHRSAFPTNVWSRLGGRLLTAYLRLFLDSPHALALGALPAAGSVGRRDAPAGEPVGHLVGILDTRLHREWVWRHGALRLLIALAPAAIRHPRLLAGLMTRRLRVLSRRPHPPRSAPDTNQRPVGSVAVLSHVAVDPSWRGLGLGEALVEEFLGHAAESGAGYACLATLEEEGAGAWYEARHWTLDARRETFDGRRIRIYRRTLDQDGAA